MRQRWSCRALIVLLHKKKGVPLGDVATRFWQRIPVDVQRRMHWALVRRVCGKVGGRDGFGRVIDGAALLGELMRSMAWGVSPFGAMLDG